MYGIVCPPPKVTSSSVTMYLTPFAFYYPHLFPSGNDYAVVYIYEFLFVELFFSTWLMIIPLISSLSGEIRDKWRKALQ